MTIENIVYSSENSTQCSVYMYMYICTYVYVYV